MRVTVEMDGRKKSLNFKEDDQGRLVCRGIQGRTIIVEKQKGHLPVRATCPEDSRIGVPGESIEGAVTRLLNRIEPRVPSLLMFAFPANRGELNLGLPECGRRVGPLSPH